MSECVSENTRMERVTLLVGGSRRRRHWCRRYSPFFIVGIAILIIQILLGYCFYITAKPDDKGYAWVNNAHQIGAGRHQSAQSDDDYEEEESAAGLLPPDTSLGFHPPCDITEKDVVSAIRRATSMDCKMQLANVSCLVKEWHLYPRRLPRYCPLTGEASVRHGEMKLQQGRPVSSGERARIAFVLSVSGRALRQVLRLLRMIYSGSHFYYIHVDARQDYLFRELLWLEERFSNIRLARKRFPTMWGGSSLLHMLLHAMTELLHTPAQWHYLINLSETDYPIKPLEDLEQFLAANMGTNFVKSHGQDTQRFIAKQALDRTFHQCDGRMWRLGPRGLPWGVRLDGGSDWLALHRDFVSYVALGDDPLLRGLKALFSHTLLPAESFFHTTLQNSAFCGTVVDNNLHLVNWKRKQGCKCQYRHVVDWCGCSPNVFRSPDDWIRLRATTDRPLFFARKFEPVISQHMVDQVEQYHLKLPKRPSELLGAQSYWQSAYGALDTSPPTDEARVAAYSALSQLASKWIQQQHSCSADFLRVTQVTLYFDNDVFKGLLVAYKASTVRSQQPVEVEAWVKSVEGLQRFQEGRLISLQVGSDFDPKEQLLRNFGGLLGPRSDIVAVHEWGPGSKEDQLEVTFIWQDPTGVSTASTPIQIDTLAQVLQHRPTIHQPLAEGTWTLSLLSNGKKLAQTRFAIIGSSRTPHGNSTQSNLIAREALVSKFWTVVDSCFVSVPSHPTGGAFCDRMDSCQTTSWSSYFPDPKSRVNGFGPR